VFIRLMMGKVEMKMWKKGDMDQFRAEYNKFKLRTTIIFIIFPLVQLLLVANRFLFTLHQTWLIYYYTSLALRENILQLNGSNIKAWWIYHHYISSLMCLILVAWPVEAVLATTRIFLLFGLFQGLIMFVQSRYQENRHYVRRSLEKAKPSEVYASETLIEKPTDLKILVPLLYTLYIFELGLGGWLLLLASDWPTGLLGGLFLILGVGNALTTGIVVHQKQFRAIVRNIPSKKLREVSASALERS